MEVYGRKVLDYGTKIALDCDEIVFIMEGGEEMVVSLYRARNDSRIEVRSNTGPISVHPRAANLIEVEPHRH